MLNLQQIDKFRHNFFDEDRNVNYLLKKYKNILCDQKTFINIIHINNNYQFHTKIYYSDESYEELHDSYISLCKTTNDTDINDNKNEQQLQYIINIRDSLKNCIKTQNVKEFNKLIKIYDSHEIFHIATLKYRFDKYFNNNKIKYDDMFYCFSEIYDTMIIEDDDILSEATRDNPTHIRVLFKKKKDDIYMYDPDVCVDFNKIKYFFNYVTEENIYLHHYLGQFVPIQETTDDCYCVFHCLRLLQIINKYDMYDYDKIYSKILKNKFKMKEWVSELNKKILKYEKK